jgi:hypothetical protein
VDVLSDTRGEQRASQPEVSLGSTPSFQRSLSRRFGLPGTLVWMEKQRQDLQIDITNIPLFKFWS